MTRVNRIASNKPELDMVLPCLVDKPDRRVITGRCPGSVIYWSVKQDLTAGFIAV